MLLRKDPFAGPLVPRPVRIQDEWFWQVEPRVGENGRREHAGFEPRNARHHFFGDVQRRLFLRWSFSLPSDICPRSRYSGVVDNESVVVAYFPQPRACLRLRGGNRPLLYDFYVLFWGFVPSADSLCPKYSIFPLKSWHLEGCSFSPATLVHFLALFPVLRSVYPLQCCGCLYRPDTVVPSWCYFVPQSTIPAPPFLCAILFRRSNQCKLHGDFYGSMTSCFCRSSVRRLRSHSSTGLIGRYLLLIGGTSFI